MANKTRQYRFNQHTQSIQYVPSDEMIFNHTASEAPIVDETISSLSIQHGQSKYLAPNHVESITFDTYNKLQKFDPKINPNCADPLVSDLMDRIERDSEFAKVRGYTVGDPVCAALGTCGLVGEVIRNLPEDVRNAANEHQQAKQDADEAQNELECYEDDDGIDQDPETLAELQSAAKAKQDAAKAAGQKLNAALKANGVKIAKAVQSGMSKASAQAGAMNAACNAFGMNDAAVSGGLSIEEKFAIADAIQRAGGRFQKVVEMIGRARISAERKHAEKLRHDGGEIVDITQGNDVPVLLDEELAMLRHSTFKTLQRAKFYDEALDQFEVESREPKQRGDILALVDESGSMSGQRDAEAKAVIMALAHIAIKQRRKVRVMFFQTSVTARFDINSTRDGMAASLRNLGQIARRGTGGGTCFDGPMRTAIESTDDLREPDLLIITDGEATISEATMEDVDRCKKDRGLNVYAMMIGTGGYGSEEIHKFADRVWHCDSLLGKASEQLFEAVI